MPLASKAGASVFLPLIKAQATATRAVLASESGVRFTTRGATAAVTFTLPAVTNLPIGTEYTFHSTSAYGMVIASNGSLNNILTLNNATGNSITCTTTSKIIGAVVHVIYDGTAWLASQASVGNTYAVA